MTDDELRNQVISVLKAHHPAAGFQGADVRSDVDYDGESIIRVTARYARRPDVTPDPLIDAAHAIRARLIGMGEDRFVFLTNDVETERALEPVETD